MFNQLFDFLFSNFSFHFLKIRQMKRYAYTFIQIFAAGLLITIKITNFAFLFPFILVLLVPFRKWCLPFIFTDRELNEVEKTKRKEKKTFAFH